MSFGIKQSDCKFYVDEEKRTVVCVIPETRGMLRDFIVCNFEWPDFDVYSAINGYKFLESLMLPKSFIGKAVCSPDDEWNEELGRMIAFSRAKDKCYKSFFKRANKLIQNIDRRLGDMIEIFNDFGMKLENKHITLEEKIKGMTQE